MLFASYLFKSTSPLRRSALFHRCPLHRMHGSLLFVFIMILSWLGAPLHSFSFQDDSRIEDLFARALADYRSQAYTSALAGFQEIVDHTYNQRYTSALLMVGKTHYKLGNFDEAIHNAKRLLREFPSSSYADDARYVLGNCYYRQKEYVQAAEEYLIILEAESDRRVTARARSLLEILIAEKMKDEDIRRLSRRHPENQLLLEASAPVLTQFKVGVISPLTGDLSEMGQEMVQGIKLALRRSDFTHVDLIIEDCRSDPIQTVQAAQKLVRDESVVAIIGPVRSETTVGAAAVANCEEVVLITPTATETGLSDIGSYIFQLNVTPQRQGEAMAEYAVDQLGFKRFAVLSVSDSYGKDLAGAFVSEVERLGGTILSQEWYYEGTTDFSPQLTHIREAGLVLEQADSSAWEWKIFELKTSGLIDTTTDELFPPVDSIDGLFLAAYAEDIALIAPQVAFQKISTQLLGANSWNSEEVVHAGGTYVEGAIFAADFFERNPSDQYLEFLDAYQRRYGEYPTNVAALGYDAMKLVSNILEEGIRSREQLRDRLEKTHNFQGASGITSFPHGRRANSHVFFLTIRQGEIVEVK